jgi:hypothetical protein
LSNEDAISLLFKLADKSLYFSKNTGKNKVSIFYKVIDLMKIAKSDLEFAQSTIKDYTDN